MELILQSKQEVMKEREGKRALAKAKKDALKPKPLTFESLQIEKPDNRTKEECVQIFQAWLESKRSFFDQDGDEDVILPALGLPY